MIKKKSFVKNCYLSLKSIIQLSKKLWFLLKFLNYRNESEIK
jgi:hypothetical protein